MIIEGMGILKKFSRNDGRDRGRRILTEVIVVTGVDQEKEVYPPEGTIITMIGKIEVPGLDQDLEADLIQG